MRLIVLLLATLAAPASAERAGAFRVVESGEAFADLQDAVDAIGNAAGTILIAPGRYKACAVQEAGHVSFRAAQPGTVIFDGGVCEGKASLVLRGRSAHVEGLTFTNTFVEDGNGAGIRIERGDLVVSGSRFHDAQTGILSAEDPSGRISIDRSTFSGLGMHGDEYGVHSIYIGGYGALRVTNSRFERGTSGHYLKSRAARIAALDNSFDDSRGTNTNYMIDLSNGAVGRIAGNSFVNGSNKENYGTMIAVAAEGSVNPSAGLVVENNRAWLVPNARYVTTFVGSWTDEPLVVRNNLLAPAIQPFGRR